MKSILLVDDESEFRHMLERALVRAGYQVEAAENGEVALEVLRREPIDVVVTDLVMPEKEGLETITEMKALRADQRIIAMSGGGRLGPETYLEIARSLGAAYVLSKPFAVKELLAALEALSSAA